MVIKKPHILSYTSVPAPTKDGNGDWIVPENSGEPSSLECRAVPNGNGRTINTQDGVNVVYSWKIYLDKDCPSFAYGQRIELLGIGSGEVKMFKRGQFSATLWV